MNALSFGYPEGFQFNRTHRFTIATKPLFSHSQPCEESAIEVGLADSGIPRTAWYDNFTRQACSKSSMCIIFRNALSVLRIIKTEANLAGNPASRYGFILIETKAGDYTIKPPRVRVR